MAPVASRKVLIAKPSGSSFGDALTFLRAWLLCRKLRPSIEIIIGAPIGFEVGFSSNRAAKRFEAFEWPPTVTPRFL